MYVILDNTMATMGDLIAFEGYLNASTPFDFDEHNFVWKTERRYFDFQPGNSANDSCNTPTFYYDAGVSSKNEKSSISKDLKYAGWLQN